MKKNIFALIFAILLPTIAQAQSTAALSVVTNGNESGPVAIQYRVTLDATNNSGSAMNFDINPTGGTATAGSDYTNFAGGTISVSNGSATGTLNVTVINDSLLEDTNETVEATISNPPVGITITTAIATANIIENDTATVSLSTTTNGSEGTTNIVYTATLSKVNNTSSPITVNISSSGGTATSGLDYTAITGTVSIANGASTGTKTVTVTDDALLEAVNETLQATISSPSIASVTIGTASATANITDNDTATVALSATTNGIEGSTNIVFTATLSKQNDTGSAITVNLASSGGTATSGSDYTAITGTISIANGATSGTRTINVTDDALLEPTTETLQATISSPSLASVTIGTASATANITDNDTATISLSVTTQGNETGPVSIVYTATLSKVNNTGAPITVNINPTGGTATVTSDYADFTGTTISIASAASSGTRSVVVVNDTLFENTETLTATISSPSFAAVTIGTASATANITDNDNGAGTINAALSATTSGNEAGPVNAVFTVTLSKTNDTSGNINFTINPTGGIATSGSDYTSFSGATISVLPGASTGTYSVITTDDMLFENNETLIATISGASDPAIAIGTASATGTIIDNDNTNVDASISVTTHGAEAGQVAIDYTVTLAKTNNTQSDITIEANGTGGTATVSLDYTGFSGTILTIPVGASTATFSVPVRDDTLFENNETLIATISNASDPGITFGTASIAGNIVDNDNTAASINANLLATPVADETGATAFTYTVSIAKTNNTGVPITFALNPGGTATPGADFTNYTGTILSIANGASSATYTANTVDDLLFENNETVIGTITSPSDPAINIVTGSRTTTIIDNDNVNASVDATLTAFAVGDEAGPTPLTFRITLTKVNNTGVPITFAILRTGGSATAGSDFTDFNGGTISVPNGSATGDLNVAVSDDLLFESNESVSALVLNQSDPAIRIISPRATGTINDNDNLANTVDAVLSVTTNGSETGPVNIVYTVTLSKINFTGGNVSFNIAHTGGTTTPGTDFTSYGTTAIFVPNGSNTGTFSVDVTNDILFESTETATATISSPSHIALNIITASATATITDNDSPVNAVLSVSRDGDENGPLNVIYTVTLNKTNNTGAPITFNINPTGGSATAGTDYTNFTGGTISVPNGAFIGNLNVGVVNDATIEGTETATATISSPSNPSVNITGASATANIGDNDQVEITYNANFSMLTEGNETGPQALVFSVSLSSQNATGSPITFDINPTGGTATAGTDYTTFSGGTIAIPNGASTGTLSVAIIDDTLWENDETVIATLSNPSSGAVTITNTTATGDIIDNDNGQGTIPVTLSVTQQGSEVGPTNINFRLVSSKVNNTGAPITFSFNPSGGSAAAGADYTNFAGTTLSIPNGSDTANFTVTVLDDILFENTQTVGARISSPSDAAINLSTSVIVVSANITDNDNPVGGINADLSISQHGSEAGPVNIVYTVTLAVPNDTGGNINFTLTKTGGIAIAGSDYITLASNAISVPSGSNTGTFTVQVTEDTAFENTETLELTMSAPTDPAININTAIATGNIVDNDNAAASINATLSSSRVGTETGPTNLVYTISIPTNNYSVNGDLTFTINPTGGTATAGSDYSSFASGTITIPYGKPFGNLNVSVIDDTLFENTETVIATASSPSDPAINLTSATVTGEITDNDNAANSISAALSVNTNGDEDGPTSIIYRVTLSKINDSSSPINFTINPVGGTATAGSDYTNFAGGTISVNPGSLTGDAIISVVDDTLFENDETVQARISASSDPAVFISTNSATATLADNDNDPVEVNADLSVTTNGNEAGLVSIVYTATLSNTNNTAAPITLTLDPNGGTATAGSDYTNFPATTITIPIGASTGTATVAVLQDTLFENTETVIGTISSPSDPAVGITTPNATANIIDNDNGAGTISAALAQLTAGNETGPVSIVYRVTLGVTNNTHGPITFAINPNGGTATVIADYSDYTGSTITVADGASTGTLTVPVVNDTLFENNETAIATISSPSDPAINITTANATASIIDNDNTTNTINADIVVTQNGNETGPVSLIYTLTIAKINNTASAINFNIAASGSATNGSDYATFPATLSIPIGSDTASFTRAVTDDTLFENTETAIATISSPSDPAIRLNTPAASATITDNDNAAATITANLDVQTQGNETGPTAILYRVTLSKANNTHANVSFTINPTGGSATATSDYTNFASGTISVPDGQTVGTLSIPVVNDALFENNETVQATITSPTDPATTIGTASATATITDNDNGAGTVNTVLSATTNGTEAGPVSIVYTVTLARANNTHAPITLAINPTGGTATVVTEYDNFAGSTITILDGASTGTLTVPVYDDTLFENNETVQATISSPSDPALGLGTPSANALIIDNDNGAGSINTVLSLITGGDETGPVNIQVQVTIAKVNNTHGPITVNLAQTAGTTSSGVDYTIGGTVTIADGASTGTATLTVANDTLFENNESTTLTISSPSDPALTIVTPSVFTGIVDNDNGIETVAANLSTTTNGNEAGPVSIVYTVTLGKANNTHSPITFNINPTAGTATAVSDYANFASSLITVADGATTGTRTITVVNDALFENNETVTATIDTQSDPAVAIGTASSSATIIDNDNGAGAVGAALSVTTQGNETGPVSIVYTVTLANVNNTGSPITFNINPTAGTATAGVDYTNFAGSTITIANGASTGTLTVAVTNDTLFENTETVTATISAASDPAVGISTASATANIIDNDNAAASITANIGAINVGLETGPVNMTVPVTISTVNNTHAAITFTLAQLSGTATSGVDYTFSGTVSIPDGSDTGNAILTVVNDALFENNETLTMRISSPSDPAISINTSDAASSITDNDNGTASINAALSTTTQGNETGPVSIVYTVTLANANNTGTAITFNINPTAGTATAVSDYADFTGTTISVANGSATGTRTIAVVNDTLFENTETVTATISSPSDPAINIATASSSANITDNDNGAASINAALSVTTQGNETGPINAVYTVTLGTVNNTGSAITFVINPTGGTATAGTDYFNFAGLNITVPNGSSTGTYSVAITNDALFENTETITATISSPSDPAISIGTSSATANITDSDNVAASINADLSVTTQGNETGPVSIVYTVTLATVNNTGSAITFSINPTGGTATVTSDYANFASSLITVANGASTGTRTITVVDDALLENTETVEATISSASDPAININTAIATANIIDNDNGSGSTNADISVTTQGNETGPISIVYTVTLAAANNTGFAITFDVNPTGGTATATGDYANFAGSVITIANGASTGTLTVPVVDDGLFENTETVEATISNVSDPAININTASATANITDSDNAAASIDADISVTTQGNETGPISIVYTVTLANANNTGAAITFDVNPTSGTATATNDYTDFTNGTITVANGASTGTLTVTVVDDTLFENTETVEATISNASDPAINIDTASATANITDSDNAAASIDADISVTTQGNETGPISIVYTVTLAQPNNTGAPITFTVNPTGGTATATDDYSDFANATITIADGASTGTLTVTVVNDTLFENIETVEATISNASDPAININTPTVSANITDSDNAAASIDADISVTTQGNETGPISIVYTVTLATVNNTGAGITFTVNPTDGTATATDDYSDFASGTITVANGASTGTLTVTVVDDALFENTETVEATISNASDPAINIDTASATANITDSDNAAASIDANLSVTTNGQETGPVNIVYTLTLANVNNTGSAITFNLNPTGGTATAGSDYNDFAGTTLSIAQGSSSTSFTVFVIDDLDAELTETLIATISNASDPAININTAAATASILDNEAEVVESPFYTIWNSFLSQVNIEVLANKSNTPVNLTATILGLNGNVLGQQSLTLQPKQEFDLIINDIPGYAPDTYGLVRVDFDVANSIEGHAAIYRLPVDSTGFDENNEIEYSIIKPFSNAVSGDSYALFNTIQPSFNPADREHFISQWVQVGNGENTAQGFTLKKYDINGNELQSLHFNIPAQGRRDVEGGHAIPGQNFVGLIRIIPDSPTAKYISQVFQYSHDDLVGVFPRSFSFAMGETMRNGTNLNQYLNISRGAGAVNWVAISNAGPTTQNATLRFIDNDGTELLNTVVSLSPYSQRHFLASSYLPEGHSGTAIISSNGANLISNTRSYYYLSNGSVTEASLLEGRHLLGEKSNSIANTYLNQSNWLRIFNVSNTPAHVDIEAYDIHGNLLASKPLNLAGERGVDLEAEFNLGFNLQDDSYGVLRLVPDRPGVIFAETRRIKTFGTKLDLSQPIPFR